MVELNDPSVFKMVLLNVYISGGNAYVYASEGGYVDAYGPGSSPNATVANAAWLDRFQSQVAQTVTQVATCATCCCYGVATLSYTLPP